MSGSCKDTSTWSRGIVERFVHRVAGLIKEGFLHQTAVWFCLRGKTLWG